jgi:hypothetical protein
MITDLFRALVILLSLVVAGGFVIILLSQPAVDRIAGEPRSRRGAPKQEWIAFLYLGDEIMNNEFHVRGAVRNITTAPIEQLDASLRFYSHDGTVLETAIVRMNKEKIAELFKEAGIETDASHSRARILRIEPKRIVGELEKGNIVIVAGFQGITKDMDITTLGRGGSDTTAVALATALKAICVKSILMLRECLLLTLALFLKLNNCRRLVTRRCLS